MRNRPIRIAKMTDDPGFARTLGRLVTEHRDTTVPTPTDLDSAAVIRPTDIRAAVRLWNAAQRQAGTGLESVL